MRNEPMGNLAPPLGRSYGMCPRLLVRLFLLDYSLSKFARYARIVQNVFGGDPQENLDIMVRLASRSQGDFLAFGEALQFSGQSAADAGLRLQDLHSDFGWPCGIRAQRGIGLPGTGQVCGLSWQRLRKV